MLGSYNAALGNNRCTILPSSDLSLPIHKSCTCEFIATHSKPSQLTGCTALACKLFILVLACQGHSSHGLGKERFDELVILDLP